MSRITEECEARIKSSADIVEVVGRYVPLRRAGYSWKACCPFHSEKTPSFHVNPARQSFHCFGCGVGGDAVKFVMMFENLDYPTALRRLADICGIPVIEQEEDPEELRRRRLRAKVVQLNELAAQFYHTQLCRSPEAQPARDYLKQRGVNIQVAKSWQLGWAAPVLGSWAGRRTLEAGVYLLTPYLLTAALGMELSRRFRGTAGLMYSAAAAGAVYALGNWLPGDRLYRAEVLPIWWGALVLTLAAAVFETYKTAERKEILQWS